MCMSEPHTHYSLEEQRQKFPLGIEKLKWRQYFARGRSRLENPETVQAIMRSDISKGMVDKYRAEQERY